MQSSFWFSLIVSIALSPFNLVVFLGLCISEIIYFPFSFFLKQTSDKKRVKGLLVSIIVLNWDGKHLLEKFLPSVIEAVRVDGDNHEIIVVDNGSTDESVSFLKSHFPQVKILALPENLRFTGGNNAGVQTAENDIVIFLNNDMEVDPGFLKPLVKAFDNDKVFAVSSQVFFQDRSRRREETGNTKAEWKQGFVSLYHDKICTVEENKYMPIFWAGGGSSAFDRKKFLALGGLDKLYDPFYLEDVDLSYQAWKRGWKSLLAIESVVTHKHRGTNKQKFGNNYVDNTIRKNQYLFIWKSITNVKWILQYTFLLPITQTRFVAQTNFTFETKAFFRALLQFPEVLYKRYRWRHYYCLGDKQIFEETSKKKVLPSASFNS